MQIGLLEPDNFCPVARSRLAVLGDVRDWDGRNLGEFLAPLEVLFVRLAHRVNGELLALAPHLRWVCSPTTGHNHIDEPALTEKGVRLLSLRGQRSFLETIRATPEHTFGLIIALLRHYRDAFAETQAGGWDRDRFRGEELFGSSVGIIGLGRVGYRVASYCSAFGAHVSWCDPVDVPAASEWVRMADVSSLISSSRIVVMCASHTSGQAPLLGKSEINLLAGRYFVNTARGELVDELALLEALRRRQLLGVATDVVADENGTPRFAEWRALMEGRNLLLTPHIGGATAGAMARTEGFIVEKLLTEMVRKETAQ